MAHPARPAAPAALSKNARIVLEKRYLRKDANGNIAETPSQMFRRVAAAVAADWPSTMNTGSIRIEP